MTTIEKVIVSGKPLTTVNHDPSAQRGDHGAVDIKLSAPGGENHELIAAESHLTAAQFWVWS